jgi:molybdopterin-guanine dinucleotide biosynthesis protein A
MQSYRTVGQHRLLLKNGLEMGLPLIHSESCNWLIVNMISGVSCVVLAGGESRRMGRDKAQVNLAGSSLLERVLNVVTPLFDDVMVSRKSHDGEIKGVNIIEDQLPGRGPVIGLCAALGQAKHANVFVVACDMPFISSGLINYLSSLHAGFDIVVPVRDDRPEPLFAIYSTSCLEDLIERVKQGNKGLISFIRETTRSVLYVDTQRLQEHDPALHSFVDIDSEHALKEAETMLEGAGYG